MTVLSIWKGALGRPSLRQEAIQIAEAHGVTLADLQGRSRAPKVLAARLEAYVALWEPHNRARSAFLVGKLLGGRDHSTIIKCVQAYRRKQDAASQRIAAE